MLLVLQLSLLVWAQPPSTGSIVTALSGKSGPALSPPSSDPNNLFGFLQGRFAGAVGPVISGSSTGWLIPAVPNPSSAGGSPALIPGSGRTNPLMFGVSAHSEDVASISSTEQDAQSCNGVMYEIGVLTSGKPMIKLCGNEAFVFNGTLNWGAWNHVAWTYDAESGFIVYLNGTALSLLSGPRASFTLPTSVVPAQIILNENRDSSTQGRNAILSYSSTLRFYNTALTPSQVLDDMNGFRQNGIIAEYLNQYTRNNNFSNRNNTGNILLIDAINTDTTTQTYFTCNEANGCSILTL